MKKISAFLILLLSLAPHWLAAQIPVTVRQSDINNGATITLPLITARQFVTGYGDYHWIIASSNFTYSTPVVKIGGNVNGQTALENIGGANYGTSFMTFWSPTAVFTSGWSSPNTQTLACGVNWNEWDFWSHPLNVNLSQAFSFYLVNDLMNLIHQTVALSIYPDSLQALSRKDSTTPYREMMGIYLTGTTNSVLNSIAFAVNNTSTNSASFTSLALYRDNGSGMFNASDPQLTAATNANGYAVFNNLSENIGTTNQLYFLAGQFDPSQQSRNSFISASLNSANVICAFTNAVIVTTGGNFLGKQYGFFDTTTAEETAAALALTNEVNSAVNSATNSLAVSFESQIVANSSRGNSSSSSASGKSTFLDSALPAAAAGAAAIGAAFTSDSLNQTPTSREYTPRP